MTDLSPAAQAVLNAANNAYWLWDQMCPADADVIAAAALRAAADQVAPSDLDEPRNNLPMAMECQRIRKELLAIATELEAPMNDLTPMGPGHVDDDRYALAAALRENAKQLCDPQAASTLHALADELEAQ